jgi:CHASE2 domain-containing sensor protein
VIKFIKKIFLNDYVYCFIFVGALMWLISLLTGTAIELTNPFKEALNDFAVTDLAFTKLRVDNTEEDSSFFGRLRVRSPEADTNVVIVNTARMENAALAAVINNINQHQPAVIGINEVLHSNGNRFSDSLLIGSLKNVKKLVYAVRHEDFDSENQEHKSISAPDSMFLVFRHENDSTIFRVAEMGFENMATNDKDFKTTRHFYTNSKVNGKNHQFFSVELAKAFSPQKVDAFMKRANDYEIINYLGNWDKFYSIDAIQALNNEFDPSIIRGKIVIMGYLGESLNDEKFWDDFKYYTPINKKYAGKTFPDMFETVIYANIVSQIVANRHINVLDTNFNLLLNIFICFINVIIFSILFHSAAVWWDLFSIVITLIEILVFLISTTLIFGYFNLQIDLNPSILFVLLLGTFLELYYGLWKVAIQKLFLRQMINAEAKKRDEINKALKGTARNVLNDLKNMNPNK